MTFRLADIDGEQFSKLEKLNRNISLLNQSIVDKLNEGKELNASESDAKFLNDSVKLINLVNKKQDNILVSKLKKSRSNWINILGVLLLILGIILLTWDHTRIHFIYLMRAVIVLLSTLYDFTIYYQKNCLILNPFMQQTSSVELNDCKLACRNQIDNEFPKYFDRNNIFGVKDFDELVYDSNIPVIDFNEIEEWNIKNFTSKSISRIYADKLGNLNENDFCYFDTTIKKLEHSVISYFNVTSRKNLNGYKAMWENCNKKSSRIIKKQIRRPKFLPSYLELISNSWVLLSVNESSISSTLKEEYLAMPASLRIALFCQIKGESKIKLTPVDECKPHCKFSRFRLKQGQILIFSDLWNLQYKFLNKMEDIALVLLAH